MKMQHNVSLETVLIKIAFFVFSAFILVSCASRDGGDKRHKQADLHYGFGTQSLMTRDYTQAVSHLEKAAKLRPEDSQIQNNLGMAYYFKGQMPLAKQHVMRALELDERNTDARSNLGSFLLEEGDLAGAEKLYQECLKDLTYEKQARVYYNLASVEFRRKNENRAIAYLKSATKEDENYCAAWQQLGQMAYKRRNWEEAKKDFKAAGLGACANSPAPLYWQALVMISTGDYLDARMKLDELESRFHDSAYTAMARERQTEINLLERQARHKTAGQVIDSTQPSSF